MTLAWVIITIAAVLFGSTFASIAGAALAAYGRGDQFGVGQWALTWVSGIGWTGIIAAVTVWIIMGAKPDVSQFGSGLTLLLTLVASNWTARAMYRRVKEFGWRKTS